MHPLRLRGRSGGLRRVLGQAIELLQVRLEPEEEPGSPGPRAAEPDVVAGPFGRGARSRRDERKAVTCRANRRGRIDRERREPSRRRLVDGLVTTCKRLVNEPAKEDQVAKATKRSQGAGRRGADGPPPHYARGEPRRAPSFQSTADRARSTGQVNFTCSPTRSARGGGRGLHGTRAGAVPRSHDEAPADPLAEVFPVLAGLESFRNALIPTFVAGMPSTRVICSSACR